jgi:hypothetical protein
MPIFRFALLISALAYLLSLSMVQGEINLYSGYDAGRQYAIGDFIAVKNVDSNVTYRVDGNSAGDVPPVGTPVTNTNYFTSLADETPDDGPTTARPDDPTQAVQNSQPGVPGQGGAKQSLTGNEILIESTVTGERAAWDMQGTYRQFHTLDNVLSGGISIEEFTSTNKIVAAGDFDKDGNIDILSDDSTSGIKTIKFLVNNSVSLSKDILSTSTSIKVVGVADFNNDGILDIVTDDSTTGSKTIHYLTGSGTNLSISSTLSIVTDSSYRIAGVVDMNGDNNPDFITEQRTSSTDPLFKVNRQIWYTNGTGITSRISWLDYAQEWTIINAGDLDNDGTPDLMVEQSTTGRKGIWYMHSDDIREGFEYVTLEEKWKSACVADFNNDGSTDALFQDTITGNVIILHLGNQDGSGNPGGAKYTVQLLNLNFVPASDPVATTHWKMKGFVDHDLNGQSSILAQNTSTGDIALWDLNSGSLSSSTFKNASTNLRIVGTGQFSGTSTPDIILEDTTNGNKICWEMNLSSGSYTISSEVTFLTDIGCRIVGIGDFDGDSYLDLVVEQVSAIQSPTHKTYRHLWYMNGTQRVNTEQFLYFDQEWEIKGTKDFDGNGTPDMIVEQKNVGRRGVWYMDRNKADGRKLVEGFIYCTVDPSWQSAN